MFFPLMWDFSYFYDTTDLFSVVKSQTLVGFGGMLSTVLF